MARRYEKGGLALAVGGTFDDDEDPSIVPEILEDVGALGEVASKPAHLPTQSSRIGRQMTNTDAMERLKEARGRLQSRLESTEKDRTGEWLAFAQGMLAPTKTGGFGESLGAAAGAVGEARSERIKSLTDIEEELLSQEVKTQQVEAQSRARLGSRSTVYHPDDVEKYPKDKSKWRHIEKQTIVHADGETEHIFTGTTDGKVLQVVSSQSPITVSEKEMAKVAAGDAAKLRSNEIEQGLNSTLAVNKLQTARDLFAELSTSGIKGKYIDFAQFMNIKLDDNSSFQLARRLMGDEVLSQLTRLTGTKTDFEYRKIEELNASTAKGKEANLKIIDDMLGRYEKSIQFGEAAALERAEDPDTDLSVSRFRNFRNEQSARAEMKQVQGRAKQEPNEKAEAKLIKMFDINDPRNEAMLDSYAKRFPWPPSPDTLSALRAKGATF
jgi:hypothetical protein